MNYADGSQDVLESYGKQNVCNVWTVQKKYDPNGVVQTWKPGGFKLPADASC